MTNANFFSVLTDGSEDASITEKEAVFVQYLDRKPPGQDTVKVTTAFLRLVDLKFGTAPGIVNAIKNSFEAIITDDFNMKLLALLPMVQLLTVVRERELLAFSKPTYLGSLCLVCGPPPRAVHERCPAAYLF